MKTRFAALIIIGLIHASLALAAEKWTITTCAPHGGVDCQAGADTDGSVICRDGHRDSTQRHLWSCRSTKLSVLEVKALSDTELVVALRNTRDIAAKQPKLTVLGHNLSFAGPAEIEPLGTADYKTIAPGLTAKKLQQALLVSCQNCD